MQKKKILTDRSLAPYGALNHTPPRDPSHPFTPVQHLSETASMTFQNRHVKAVIGLVIVNDGVQLSGGKSLADTKLVSLHFGAG